MLLPKLTLSFLLILILNIDLWEVPNIIYCYTMIFVLFSMGVRSHLFFGNQRKTVSIFDLDSDFWRKSAS